jgi:hypothetical protein
MLQSQQSQARLGAQRPEEDEFKMDVSELLNLREKLNNDSITLSKSGVQDPLEMVDITDETKIVLDERKVNFKTIQIAHRNPGLKIAPGEPDMPPTVYVLETTKLFLEAQKRREALRNELEKINVEYYAKYLEHKKIQQEYAKFETRVKNLIYFGATKLAYIGVMTYVGPLAISFFLNNLCAIAAPIGPAKLALKALQEEQANLKGIFDAFGPETVSPEKTAALKQYTLKSAEVEEKETGLKNLESDIQNSTSSIIFKFVMEAFMGLTPGEMQQVDGLLRAIQENAIQIFSDPKSQGRDPNSILQSAFGTMDLFGFKPGATKEANESILMPKFVESALNLRAFLFERALGPLNILLKSPEELLKEAGQIAELPRNTPVMEVLKFAQGVTGYKKTLGALYYGAKGKQIVDKVSKAKNLVMNYYRDYTFEINNIVGIFTGSNKEYDDPAYINKHFNKVVKRPFNSMALRNGIVGKVENYFFGATGGKAFNLFSTAAGADDPSKSKTAAATNEQTHQEIADNAKATYDTASLNKEAADAYAKQTRADADAVKNAAAQAPANARLKQAAADAEKTAMDAVADAERAAKDENEARETMEKSKIASHTATMKEGTWAFFNVGPISSLFHTGIQASSSMFDALKRQTIQKFTPRNCVGTAVGALFDSVSQSVTTQVQSYLPDEKPAAIGDDNEMYESQMKEYEDGLRAHRLSLIKQGYSGDALVNMMRETAVTSDPAYVLNAQDHSALEYAWIKVQRKAKELQKSGIFYELFLLWGAGGSAHLFGMMANHYSTPSRESSGSFKDIHWYGMGPNLFIETFASYKSANAEAMTARLSNELNDTYNEIYRSVYDEYIRKPALNSDLGKWLHKNIREKSKSVAKKVLDRIYLSVYINQVWGKLVDTVFDTLINMPLNIPNTIITNMQYDIYQAFGIYDYLKPTGWRFIMDSLSMSNIKKVYSNICVSLQTPFSNCKAVASGLATTSMQNYINHFVGNVEVHREGFESLSQALGHDMAQELLGLQDISKVDRAAATQKWDAALQAGDYATAKLAMNEQLNEWENMRDSYKSSNPKREYYQALIDWLRGQHIIALANQANITVEEYLEKKFRKDIKEEKNMSPEEFIDDKFTKAETAENLLAFSKLKDSSYFIPYMEKHIKDSLYQFLRPAIGERSYKSHYAIPIGNGQYFEITDEKGKRDYREALDIARVTSLVTLNAYMNDSEVTLEFITQVAFENNVSLTEAQKKRIQSNVPVRIQSAKENVSLLKVLRNFKYGNMNEANIVALFDVLKHTDVAHLNSTSLKELLQKLHISLDDKGIALLLSRIQSREIPTDFTNAEFVSELTSMFDDDIENANIAAAKGLVPANLKITDLPLMYFQVGSKSYKIQEYNDDTKDAYKTKYKQKKSEYESQRQKKVDEISQLQAANEKLKIVPAGGEPNDDSKKQLAENDKKLEQLNQELNKIDDTIRIYNNLLIALDKGPRTLWEHTFGVIIVETPDDDTPLDDKQKAAVAGKAGFSLQTMSAFNNISHVQDFILFKVIPGKTTGGFDSGEKMYTHTQLTGFFKNFVQEEQISHYALNQRFFASGVIDTFMVSDGFDLLDRTTEGGQLHMILKQHLLINPSFTVNMANYAQYGSSLKETQEKFYANLDKLKPADPERYAKIQTQLDDIRNGTSSYLDREFMPEYNLIESLKQKEKIAYDAALSALPNYVLAMLRTNKNNVIEKYKKEVERHRNLNSKLKTLIEQLNDCNAPNAAQSALIKESQGILDSLKSAHGDKFTLHVNTGEYLLDEEKNKMSSVQVKQNLKGSQNILNLINGGCVSKNTIDALTARSESLTNLLNESEQALNSALASNGLNLVHILTQINELSLYNIRLTNDINANISYNKTYTKLVSELGSTTSKLNEILVAQLLASISQEYDEADGLHETGKTSFKTGKDELDAELKTRSKTQLDEKEKTYTTEPVRADLRRIKGETAAQHAARLSGILTTARSQTQDLQTKTNSIPVFFAGLKGGVEGATILVAAIRETPTTFGFLGDARNHIHAAVASQASKKGEIQGNDVLDTIDALKRNWTEQLKHTPVGSFTHYRLQTALKWLEGQAILYIKPLTFHDPFKNKEELDEFNTNIDLNLDVPAHLKTHLPLDYAGRLTKINNLVDAHNANLREIAELQTKLKTYLNADPKPTILDPQAKADFDKLLNLLDITSKKKVVVKEGEKLVEYDLQAEQASHDAYRKSALVDARRKYVEDEKTKLYNTMYSPVMDMDGTPLYAPVSRARAQISRANNLLSVPNRNRVSEMKPVMRPNFQNEGIQEEKDDLMALLKDLHIIQDKDKIEKIQKQIAGIDLLIEEQEKIWTMYENLRRSSYHHGMPERINSFNALVEEFNGKKESFIKTHGTKANRDKARKATREYLNSIYETEYNILVAQRNAAYAGFGEPLVQQASALLTRYRDAYGESAIKERLDAEAAVKVADDKLKSAKTDAESEAARKEKEAAEKRLTTLPDTIIASTVLHIQTLLRIVDGTTQLIPLLPGEQPGGQPRMPSGPFTFEMLASANLAIHNFTSLGNANNDVRLTIRAASSHIESREAHLQLVKSIKDGVLRDEFNSLDQSLGKIKSSAGDLFKATSDYDLIGPATIGLQADKQAFRSRIAGLQSRILFLERNMTSVLLGTPLTDNTQFKDEYKNIQTEMSELMNDYVRLIEEEIAERKRPAPTTAPPAPTTAPPAPTTAPPAPTTAPPAPTTAPPAPTTAPPVPTTAPPVPTTAPPVPTAAAIKTISTSADDVRKRIASETASTANTAKANATAKEEARLTAEAAAATERKRFKDSAPLARSTGAVLYAASEHSSRRQAAETAATECKRLNDEAATAEANAAAAKRKQNIFTASATAETNSEKRKSLQSAANAAAAEAKSAAEDAARKRQAAKTAAENELTRLKEEEKTAIDEFDKSKRLQEDSAATAARSKQQVEDAKRAKTKAIADAEKSKTQAEKDAAAAAAALTEAETASTSAKRLKSARNSAVTVAQLGSNEAALTQAKSGAEKAAKDHEEAEKTVEAAKERKRVADAAVTAADTELDRVKQDDTAITERQQQYNADAAAAATAASYLIFAASDVAAATAAVAAAIAADTASVADIAAADVTNATADATVAASLDDRVKAASLAVTKARQAYNESATKAADNALAAASTTATAERAKTDAETASAALTAAKGEFTRLTNEASAETNPEARTRKQRAADDAAAAVVTANAKYESMRTAENTAKETAEQAKKNKELSDSEQKLAATKLTNAIDTERELKTHAAETALASIREYVTKLIEQGRFIDAFNLLNQQLTLLSSNASTIINAKINNLELSQLNTPEKKERKQAFKNRLVTLKSQIEALKSKMSSAFSTATNGATIRDEILKLMSEYDTLVGQRNNFRRQNRSDLFESFLTLRSGVHASRDKATSSKTTMGTNLRLKTSASPTQTKITDLKRNVNDLITELNTIDQAITSVMTRIGLYGFTVQLKEELETLKGRRDAANTTLTSLEQQHLELKPIVDKENIIHDVEQTLNLLEVDNKRAEDELKLLEAEYNAQYEWNYKVDMKSISINLQAMKMHIDSLKALIQQRKAFIEEWRNKMKEAEKTNTLDAFKQVFTAKWTETDFKSISFAGGKWSTDPNTPIIGSALQEIKTLIKSKSNENDTYFNEVLKALKSNAENNSKALRFYEKLVRDKKCNAEQYTPLCDSYKQVYTEENAPHPSYVGKTHYDFLKDIETHYRKFNTNIQGQSVRPLITLQIMTIGLKGETQQDQVLTLNILLSAGLEADRARGVTGQEVTDTMPSLVKGRDELRRLKAEKEAEKKKKEEEYEKHKGALWNSKEANQLKKEIDNLTAEIAKLTEQLNLFESTINKLTQLYTETNGVYTINQTAVAEAQQLTEQEANFVKGVVQQARVDQLTQLANIDISHTVLQGVVTNVNNFMKWSKKSDLLDKTDLDFLHHDYQDSRPGLAIDLATRVAPAVAVGGTLALNVAINESRKFISAKTEEIKTMIKQTTDAFLTKVAEYTQDVKDIANYYIDEAGRIIGHVTHLGQIVLQPGINLAKAAYTKVKPILDTAKNAIGYAFDEVRGAVNVVINAAGELAGIVSEKITNFTTQAAKFVKEYGEIAAQFMVDATGKILGYVKKGGEYVWNKGVDAAKAVYSVVEPAVDVIGNFIGWSFDKLNDVANVVVDATGKFIGVVSEQLGAIVDSVGNYVGTLKTFVFDKAGKVLGRIKQSVSYVAEKIDGYIVQPIVDNAGKIVALIAGSVVYKFGASAYNWTTTKISELYNKVKTKTIDYYEAKKEAFLSWYDQSYLKRGVDSIKQEWAELKQAYQDVKPITREHAHNAFRAQFIIADFLEENETTIVSEKLTEEQIKQLKNHLFRCLMTGVTSCPAPTGEQPFISTELYNTLVSDIAFRKMVEKNQRNSGADYVTMFFLDAIYGSETELPLYNTGLANRDILSRMNTFINSEEVKQPSIIEAYTYRAVHTIANMSTMTLVVLDTIFKFSLAGAKYGITKIAGTVATTNLGWLATIAANNPVHFVLGATVIGAVSGVVSGFYLVNFLKNQGIIEGTAAQYTFGIGAGFVAGAATGAFVATLVMGAAFKYAFIAGTGGAGLAVLGIFVIGSTIYKEVFERLDAQIVEQYKLPGETKEDTIKRLNLIAQRSLANAGRFIFRIPQINTSNPEEVRNLFRKSAQRLTNVLNTNKERIQKSNPELYKKLFKRGNLSYNWFDNTSEYELDESDIKILIPLALNLDVQVFQTGGGIVNDFKQVEALFETLYYYIYLSNLHLCVFGIDPNAFYYTVEKEFYNLLYGFALDCLYVINNLGDDGRLESYTFKIPINWSSENMYPKLLPVNESDTSGISIMYKTESELNRLLTLE